MAKRLKNTRVKSKRVAPDDDAPAAPAAADATPYFHGLPDELVLKVFSHLATVPSCALLEDEESEEIFSTVPATSHAGLRQYPFLGQVCKRWRDLLAHPASQGLLWQEVVVDFGQELITAVHQPVKWSDARPSDEEFKAAFAKTRISAQRIMEFVSRRQSHVRRLALINTEGYWNDENKFVSLRHKHNFTAGCFGVLLGMLHHNLEELRVQQCNSLFAAHSDSLDALTCVAGGRLRRLHLMDLQLHISRDSLARLGSLTQLEELSVGAATSGAEWQLIGPLAGAVHTLPEAWSKMARLRRLALQGHTMLRTLPDWLARLPLESLEISACRNVVHLSVISKLTSLHTLVLLGMGLVSDAAAITAQNYPYTRGCLPALSPLTALTSLCLADNALTALPSVAAMRALVRLDVSCNSQLQVAAPVTELSPLRNLGLVDLRLEHRDANVACWSDEKCVTMSHLAALTKSLKRRRPSCVVKFCTD